MKKKYVIITLFLCILFFIWFKKPEKEIQKKYTVITNKQTFEIEETYQPKNKMHESQYLFVINDMFPIQIQSSRKKHHLIENVYYFENEVYQCVYVTGNLPKLDVLCSHNNIIYPYQTIVSKNQEVDAFVNSLKDYDKTQFIDLEKPIKIEKNTIFYEEFLSSHTIGLETYKGLLLLERNTITEKNLFLNDQYQKNIELFQNEYYLVADYNQKYEFHEFYIINLKTKKETKLISNDAISLDSYIQGSIDEKVYLLDCSYKKQYLIDLKKKKVYKIGDTSLGTQIYKNGKFQTTTMYETLKEKKQFETISFLDEIVKEQYDDCEATNEYAYCYSKNENGTQVYRFHKQMPTIGYYITTIKNDFQTVPIQDYFYWKEEDTIYYYHDLKGIRKILKNTELSFNPQLQFGVFSK